MGSLRCNDQFTGRCAIPSERETLAECGKLDALYIDRLIESVVQPKIHRSDTILDE